MIVHSISLIGKRESNEDQEEIILNIDYSNKNIKPINYLGVYDGHGGKSVSKFLKDNLSQYFTNKEININPGDRSYLKYIKKIFDHIQQRLINEHKKMATHTGSTALILIQYMNNNTSSYYIANVGDCRAIKCNLYNKAIQLTKDHKPNSPEERKRINDLNGKIIFDGYDYRIKGLSLSRAFGDLDATPYVTHKPNILKYDLLKGDKFIVMACDGLWDVMTNQQVVNFITHCLDKIKNINQIKKINIAKLLANYAINEKKSTDNVSIIIIFF